MESIVIYETTDRLELGTFKGILFEIHRILVSNDATRDRTHQLACKNARKADVESAMETWNIILCLHLVKKKPSTLRAGFFVQVQRLPCLQNCNLMCMISHNINYVNSILYTNNYVCQALFY